MKCSVMHRTASATMLPTTPNPAVRQAVGLPRR
nr:MAG TPA: hypothetical protein [Caudoviricetes sp.]